MNARRLLLRTGILAIVVVCAFLDVAGQHLPFSRKDAQGMAQDVADDVARHYYDRTLHGVDWDAKLRETREKIQKATSSNVAFANIAAMLDSLGDSHTFFIPPRRSIQLDYGWRIQIIGERCLVTGVGPETDAATKVRPGDEVLAVNEYRPARENLVRIEYMLNVLHPQNKIEATIRSVGGEERQIEIIPKTFGLPAFREGEHKRRQPHFVSLDDDVLVVKIPEFRFDEEEVNKLIDEARKHKWVILDLRGNPGGSEESLRLLVSKFFDHEVKIADAVSRNGTKPRIAKPDHHAFSGKLTVLVDSSSSSAAELFARVVQLEKRGIVIGDHTAGMVMEAEHHRLAHEGISFGASVTIANLIMSDGKSLEHVGVIPDELALPTVEDLANHRDPVLAHAAGIAGAKLSPEDAAQLLPYQWPEPSPLPGQ